MSRVRLSNIFEHRIYMMIKLFVIIFASVILRNEGCTKPLRSPAQLERPPRLNQQTPQYAFPDYSPTEPLGQTTTSSNPIQPMGQISRNMMTAPTRITQADDVFSDEEITQANGRNYVSDHIRSPDTMYPSLMNPRDRNVDPSIPGSHRFHRTNRYPNSAPDKLDQSSDAPTPSTLNNLMNIWRATPSLSTLSNSLSSSPAAPASSPTTSTLMSLASSLAPVILSNLMSVPSNNTILNTRSPLSSSYDFMSYIPRVISAASTVAPLLSNYERSFPTESTTSSWYQTPLKVLSSLPGSSLFGLKPAQNGDPSENDGIRHGRRRKNDLDFIPNVYGDKKSDYNQGDKYENSRRSRKSRSDRDINSNENQNGIDDGYKYNYRYEYKSPSSGGSSKTSSSSSMSTSNRDNKYRYQYDSDYGKDN